MVTTTPPPASAPRAWSRVSTRAGSARSASWRSNSAGGVSISPPRPLTRWYSRITTSPGRRRVTTPPGSTATLTALRASELPVGIRPPLHGRGRGGPAPAGRDGQQDEEEGQELGALPGQDAEVGDAGERDHEQARVDQDEDHVRPSPQGADGGPDSQAPAQGHAAQPAAL